MDRSVKEPSLNMLTTTPKNMTRFMARVGPIHVLERGIRDTLSWHNKTLTCLVLAVFTLFTLYPLLLVITPQVALVLYIAKNYYHRAQQSALRSANMSSLSPSATVPVATAFNSDPSPVLKLSEYKENLQFMQNLMGMHCDCYDTLVLFSRQYLSWSSSEDTKTLLQLTIISVLPTLLAFYYIPLNHLILVTGWILFLANTSLAAGIRDALQPILLETLNDNWVFAKGIVRRWPEIIHIKKTRPSSVSDLSTSAANDKIQNEDQSVYMVAIYENHRWWLGLGFINYLLSNERTAWTDYTGEIPLPPKSSYLPPSGFSFFDDEWHVDHAWCTVTPDKEGWVYSDHAWNNQRTDPGLGALTRRRKWVRRVLRRREEEEIDTVNDDHSPLQQSIADESTISSSHPSFSPSIINTTTDTTSSSSFSSPSTAPAADTISPLVLSHSSVSTTPLTSADENTEIEYILEVAGQEVVIEGERSLDTVDLNKVQDMVQTLQQTTDNNNNMIPSTLVNDPITRSSILLSQEYHPSSYPMYAPKTEMNEAVYMNRATFEE